MKQYSLILPSETSNKLMIAEKGNNQYIIKYYTGANGVLRKRLEAQRLKLWSEAGFKVPRVSKAITVATDEPYLVLEFISGITLREYLRSETIETKSKLSLLRKLFFENAIRHRRSISTNDRTFIHHDLNTGNILVTKDDFVLIDFEDQIRSKPGTPMNTLAGLEIRKLLRWATRDMGKKFLPQIVALMLEAYRWSDAPRTIVERVYRRPFQFLHRWRDRFKLKRNPWDVTKYDIADAIAALSGNNIP
jgi:serine/threonine protein kinase